MRTTKIYVGNLPDGCTTDELRVIFEQYGKVAECDIVKNYGFVHMSSDEEAQNAITALHGTEIRNAKISVEASHSKVRQKPGMGGKGQCYRCGESGHWSKDCPSNDRVRRDNNHQSSNRSYNNYHDPGYSKKNYSSSVDSYGPIRRTKNISNEQRVWARPYPEQYQRVAPNNYIMNNNNISHQPNAYAPLVPAQASLQPNYGLNQQPLLPGHQTTQTLGLIQPNYMPTQQTHLHNSHLQPTNQIPVQHQAQAYQNQLQPALHPQLALQSHPSTSTMHTNNNYMQPHAINSQSTGNYYYRRPHSDYLQYNRPSTKPIQNIYSGPYSSSTLNRHPPTG